MLNLNSFALSITEIKGNLFFLTTNALFEPPFEEAMGNVTTSSIARWKARIDFLIAIIDFFR